MNRKAFLAGLGTFYLVSGCAAAWLVLKQPDSTPAEAATEAELVLPSSIQETETVLEIETIPETETETETWPETEAEPETLPEETPEDSTEAEAPVSYSYRAIHQKYRLFIREAPDASAKSLGYLKPGNTGDVISVDGDWVLLEHDGITGYVSSQFLELTEKQDTP